jgi:hypothetical protein
MLTNVQIKYRPCVSTWPLIALEKGGEVRLEVAGQCL